MKYGTSLANLHYPEIPARDGFYGAWPDLSDQVMKGNLLIDGSYVDTVTVVESSEKAESTGENAAAWQKPYALVEKVKVYGLTGGDWTEPESKARGQYLQVDMTGPQESFCIVNTKADALLIAVIAVAVIAAGKAAIQRLTIKSQALN